MKFYCLGYLDEQKWEALSEDARTALMDECFAYDDALREGGRILILEARDRDHAVQLMSKHPGVKMGPFEIRAIEDISPLIRENAERRRSAGGRA
jgi:hypothetical protein